MVFGKSKQSALLSVSGSSVDFKTAEIGKQAGSAFLLISIIQWR
jgi:hypothetical protein